MNKYPVWKYVLIAVAILVAFVYTVPNFFGEVPAVQVSGLRTSKADAGTQKLVEEALKDAKVEFSGIQLDNETLRVKFSDTDSQLKGRDAIQQKLGPGYIAALNLMSNSPSWLYKINAQPMYLGLDLRGGVHFLMQVDMKAATDKAVERYAGDIRTLLRDKKVFYNGINREGDRVVVRFKEKAEQQKGLKELSTQLTELALRESEANGEFTIAAAMKPETLKAMQDTALQQNITALRKRVNELGVSEPIVQQQGPDRILVQLAGVQDPTRAKDVIGRTATLELRMVAEEHMSGGGFEQFRNEPAPFNTEKMPGDKGEIVLVRKALVITGDKVTDAQPGFDQQTARPVVNVRLDAAGGRVMLQNTRENVGKRMAMILIEKGKPEVLTWPVINGEFGSQFQITGGFTTAEAKNLALLLRAGALAAPMEIIEERTIGPSLGAENIKKGKDSLLYGFALITVFMIVYYALFGVVSVISLAANLLFLVALLSMLQATLTLPGIAAIALTLGMAIDANVLINERIREELRAGVSPQMAIQAGYDRALDTIIDSNVTTLIAGLALLIWGSGPVRGFAVVHCLGILTSLFSAVMVSRGLVNLIYGGRKKVAKLSIGNVDWHKTGEVRPA
ncbi:MAG TPA: protein translocase subunit SecD [Usitatibacteraceae bacterium]|nr:protein translocase subunit SecD [Usitatibacteraceae bacterium]